MVQSLPIERAAGGLVVRTTDKGREVLLIDDAYGRVTFPKGHVEPGETWEDAAIREIEEETGITARILAPLGRVEYRIQRGGQPVRKQVRLFLLEAVDESQAPVSQLEEIGGAYYLPWAEAQRRHDERGYENWSWVFAKADVLWRWHEQHWEQRWRGLSASASDLDEVWRSVQPLVRDLLQCVTNELRVVARDWFGQWQSEGHIERLPLHLGDETEALRRAIEHTLLRPEASELDIDRLCREALQHRFHAVCVNPQHVRRAREQLGGSGVEVCTVIGFPLGAAHPRALAAETAAVIADGAREVDMVIPVGSMREDDVWTVYEHVRAVTETARQTPGVTVKAILETHFLTYDQLAKAVFAALAAGADFVKTSTGFAPTGARVADVALMAVIAGDRGGVKASGGVRTRAEAVTHLRYGASRIGTSSGPALVRH